jgi:hypothetical protein
LVVHGDDTAELIEINTDDTAILGTFGPGNPEPGEDYSEVDGQKYVVR